MLLSARTSLLYIAKTFLIVGFTAFGGFSALVAVVTHRMVNRDRKIDEEVIMNGFSLASILPGPVAVNTCAYIGYYLRGWQGAIVALVFVILPSFILVVMATHIYLMYGSLPELRYLLNGIIPVIIAIILSVGYTMTKNSVKTWQHGVILVIGLLLQFYFKGYWLFVVCLIGSALAGWILVRPDSEKTNIKLDKKWQPELVPILMVCLVAITFALTQFIDLGLGGKLYAVFTQISLTLFGGGYVMIPVLQDIIVAKYEWLSEMVFADAIAIGQVTPGPILISAAFVGYKVYGFWGATLATLGIFAPASILMILLSSSLKNISRNVHWKAMLTGVKPMVIAFIIYSAMILAMPQDNILMMLAIAIISLIAIIRFKINYLYLVLIFGVVGIFIGTIF